MAAQLRHHGDVGASVAVTVDGELVVDLWGGQPDEARTPPWERDTITNVWSTTKTMTALCALILADRGELDLHAPVARYWPEFAAAGKEARRGAPPARPHRRASPAGRSRMQLEDLYDWEKATVAARRPGAVVGAGHGLGLPRHHPGLPGRRGRAAGQRPVPRASSSRPRWPARWAPTSTSASRRRTIDRVANVIPPPPLAARATSTRPASRCAPSRNPPLTRRASWTEPWRRAEIPAANGHGNARSVADVQSVLACGGEVGGRRFLSEQGCEAVFEEQARRHRPGPRRARSASGSATA